MVQLIMQLRSVLFNTAEREGIKYVLNGSDFRSEGKQPSEWTYTDSKQMLYILKNLRRLN